MIVKVTNHKEKMAAKVEDFHTKLMTKEEGLKKTQAEFTRLLKDGHVTEKIRQKKRITEELDRHDADKLDDCELADSPTLIQTGKLSTQKTIFLPFWGVYKLFFPKTNRRMYAMPICFISKCFNVVIKL